MKQCRSSKEMFNENTSCILMWSLKKYDKKHKNEWNIQLNEIAYNKLQSKKKYKKPHINKSKQKQTLLNTDPAHAFKYWQQLHVQTGNLPSTKNWLLRVWARAWVGPFHVCLRRKFEVKTSKAKLLAALNLPRRKTSKRKKSKLLLITPHLSCESL